MTAVRAEIGRLLGEANALPCGPARVALVEEAVRRADLAGDAPLGFAARRELFADDVLCACPDDRFRFLLGASVAARRFAGRRVAKLRMRPELSAEPLSLAEFAEWVEPVLSDLARRFDARNGNAMYAGKLAERARWLAKVAPFPLTDPGDAP